MYRRTSRKPIGFIFVLSIIFIVSSFLLFKNNISSALAATLSFNSTTIDSNSPQDPWGKGVGDINGDGWTDLLIGGYVNGGLVWYENGKGSTGSDWLPKKTIDTANGFSTDIEVGDINNDGDNDVVSFRYPVGLYWYKSSWDIAHTSVSWTSKTIDADVQLHDVELADLDGDGALDVVGRNQAEFGAQGDVLYIYRQVPGPTGSDPTWILLSPSEVPSIPNGEGLKIADLDRDGKKDIVVNTVWLKMNYCISATICISFSTMRKA